MTIHDLLRPSVQSPDGLEASFTRLKEHLDYQSLQCRILVYQYEIQALLSPGEASELALFSQATTLLNELTAERRAVAACSRPLIFLCHGFGGLLVKRALALTRQKGSVPESFRFLRSSTYAVIFAGTPHHGISHSALKVLYPDSSKPPNQLILDLLDGSELLADINSSFKPFLKEIRLANLWEKVQTSSGNASALIVEEQSAAPISYTLERCGLQADHAHLLAFITEIQDSACFYISLKVV